MEAEANFYAWPNEHEIGASFAGLLSLWSTSAAAAAIANEAMRVARLGIGQLSTLPGTPARLGLDYLAAAKALVQDHTASWPKGLSPPDFGSVPSTSDWYINNLFLGAASWALLHEIAHVHLRHPLHRLSGDLYRKEEFEADAWATEWTFKNAPRDGDREFRILSVAIALSWLGLIDGVRTGLSTHPAAVERFEKCCRYFEAEPDSTALEVASYVVKAFFYPSARAPVFETAEEAFFETLFGYSQSLRPEGGSSDG